MAIVTGLLISSTVIGAVKKMYELTFVTAEDPSRERRFMFKTETFDLNCKSRHYFLTVEHNRIIEIQPAD